MKYKENTILRVLLYCVLILALLLLIFASAKIYKDIVSQQTIRNEKRAVLSFIQSQVAGCEGINGAHMEEGPEGAMLCLPESDERFETKIYLYNKGLCVELSRAGEPASPEDSDVICSVEELEFNIVNNGIEIVADGNHAFVSCLEIERGNP